ncbi:serine protease snake-like [Diaphorina citri]|uniref:Serine protease snake-like n=1 Tax=Diaphorina citri TaxID=121845 RepID=A0A3Q0JAT5_DIACI|nr:serine protease snake-like [Diaphorina citri]
MLAKKLQIPLDTNTMWLKDTFLVLWSPIPEKTPHSTATHQGKTIVLVSVRLGELNLVRNDDGASPENFKVVQVYPHPDYRSNVKYNDIALLRLDRTVEFSNSIRPACLYTSETTSMPRAIATGWGTVGFGDRSSDVLLKVGLNFIDSQKCASLYRSEQSSSLHKGIVDSGRGGISWNCGGSLVSEKFVLTAAHCTDSSLHVSVRLGELNLVRNDDGASPENFKVVQVHPHPDYRSNVKYNDIALLRLDRTVEFSNSIRPACLYTSETTSMPRAIATGWGTVGFGECPLKK